MKIFVTGASGYIGSAVAQAFARRGHEVYGLVRNEQRAQRAAAQEIVPVIGVMEHPESYLPIVDECEVLIHCAADHGIKFFELDRKLVDTLLASAHRVRKPRQLIYTSGVWVYGATGSEVVAEDAPLNPPHFLVKRVETEKLLLASAQPPLRTAIVRVGCVYGLSGSLTALWFQSAAKEGSARIVGKGDNFLAMVHILDLAELYVQLAESEVSGEIFNATDYSRTTVLQCAQAASMAAGANGKILETSLDEARKTLGFLADGLSISQRIDSSKASRLLEWKPRHSGFVEGAARYHAAWKAAHAITAH